MRKVAGSLGISTCRALLGMHAYTGCDTTSAFAGKGKSSSLTLLTTDSNVTEMFLQVGQYWNLSPELMDQLEAFTCRIYAPKTLSTEVNTLRYHLFCAKKGEMESYQLPPYRDCLVNMHRGQTIKLQYGEDAWRRIPKSQVLSEGDGRL